MLKLHSLYKSCFIFFAFAWLPNIAWADGTIAAEIDKTRGTTDDQFIYTVTITGSPEREPRLQSIDGVDIQSAGTSTSVSIVNGSMSKTQEYRFVLSPQRPGTFVIPPVTVVFGRKEQSTLSIRFTVDAAGSGQNGTAGNNDANRTNDVAFVERQFSTDKAYVGQVVISKVRLFTRARIMEASMDPKTPSTVKRIPIEGEKSYDKMVNGVPYRVIEVTEALIPLAPGTVAFAPFEFKAKLRIPNRQSRGAPGGTLDDFFDDPFFGGGRATVKTLKSDPDKLEVLPLPAAAKPALFRGWVGEFQLKANLSATSLQVGETTTLTIEVSGNGTLEGSQDIEYGPVAETKIYPDKAEKNQSVDRDSGIYSKAVFRFALVPLKPGSIRLPPVEVSVFNPVKGEYELLRADLGEVTVGGSAASGPGTSVPAQTEVAVTGDDLLPWKQLRSVTNLRLTTSDWITGSIIASVGFLVGIICLFFRLLRGRLASNDPVLRRQRALATFVKSLSKLEEEKDPWGQTLRLLCQYFVDRFSLSMVALTTDEMRQKLSERQIPVDQLREFQELLRRLDMSTYGGASQAEWHSFAKSLKDAVTRIDLI